MVESWTPTVIHGVCVIVIVEEEGGRIASAI